MAIQPHQARWPILITTNRLIAEFTIAVGGTLTKVFLKSDTSNASGAAQFDVQLDGTSIYASAPARPSIAASGASIEQTGLAVTVTKGQKCQVYSTSVPAGGIGASLTMQVDVDDGVSGGGGALTVKDEGTTLTAAATSIDFVGPGVTATNTLGAAVVTIPGAAAFADSTSSISTTTGTTTGTITNAGKRGSFIKTTFNVPARLRIYSNIANRTADNSRPATQTATPDDNVLYEVVGYVGRLVFEHRAKYANNDSPVAAVLYWTVDSTASVSITLLEQIEQA